MQVLTLDGLLFETADTEEINYRKALRDAMLQAIGTSRFALYHHIVRRRVEPQLDAEFPDPFSAALDANWRRRLESKRLFINDLYIAVIRRPRQGRGGDRGPRSRNCSGACRRTAGRRPSPANGASSMPRATPCSRRSAIMARARSAPMSSKAGCAPSCSNISRRSTMPSFARSSCPRTISANICPIGGSASATQTAELSPAGDLDRSFVGMVSVKEYPGQTAPGMLDDLLRLPHEMVVTQSFGFVDRQAALGRMNLTLRRMRAADDEALSLRGELAVARDDLAAGRAAFGEHHLTVAVRGASLKDVDDGVAEVSAALADRGMIAVREEMALEPAFWAQFPGNFTYIPRRGMISSRNFASLASLHNFALGKAEGNHWGQAVTVLETTAAGPYHFNFHHGDLGNFTVIGPSGSGKTVVLNFLLAQARKFDPRIIFFDKDRGAELFLRAIGGRYDVLRAGEPSGLNPLLLEDSAENRQFLLDWLSRLVSEPGRSLTAEDLARLKDAVDANMAAPVAFRRLEHFSQLLHGDQRPHIGDLRSRLAPWWGTGERAWLFDNAEDQVDLDERVVGFDMTRILDDPILRTPAMMYLFHRVEQRLDGTPAIIVVDEGWKALDDDVFARRIRDWEKTIRKRNGIVGFATQSARRRLVEPDRLGHRRAGRDADLHGQSQGADARLCRRLRADPARI